MEVFLKFDLTRVHICGTILGQNPIALLAQLDRVSGYGPEGQGFESLTARHEKRLHESVTLFFFECKMQEECKMQNAKCKIVVAGTFVPISNFHPQRELG